MKTISDAMQAHLNSGQTTLATCWLVVLTNGTIKCFTDHDQDLTIFGTPFLSSSGYTASAIQTTSALNVDNLEVNGFLSSPSITEEDLNAGLWDYAEVVVFVVNWADLTMGIINESKGTLGQVSLGRGTYQAEIRGLTQAYAVQIGELYSPVCRARLGDARCTVNLAPFTVTGTVGSTDSTNRIIYDAGRTEPGPPGSVSITNISQDQYAVVTAPGHGLSNNEAVLISGVVGVVQVGSYDTSSPPVFYGGSGNTLNGLVFNATVIDANNFSINVDTRLYNSDPNLGCANAANVYSSYTSGGQITPTVTSGYFTYGKLTFTSGLNNGLSMEVSAYVPGVITLASSMGYTITPGDTYSVYAGCDLSFSTCKNKFNNVINNRSEPYLPGADKILAVGGTL